MHNDTYVNDPTTGTAKTLQVDWTDQLAGGDAQWRILAEHNQNQSGDTGPHYFVPKGQQTVNTLNSAAFGKQLNRSNGSYTLATADGRAGLSYDNGTYQTGTPTTTGFGANFNWWTPRQIQIKVIVYQNDQYQPNLTPNVVDPRAKDVPAANGVKDYTGPDGSKAPTVAGQTPRVTWDHTDPQTGLPLNPRTNQPLDTTTPGVYPDVPATITYPDGSKKQIQETIVVGKIIDVTGKVPTTVPDGYLLESFNAAHGYFKTLGTTAKTYLVAKGTMMTNLLAGLLPKADQGYNQNTAKWTPTDLPATFTVAGNYTVTYQLNDSLAYQPNGQPITAGPTAHLTPEAGIKDFTGKDDQTVPLKTLEDNGTVTNVQWVKVNQDGTSTPVDNPTGVATTTTGVTTRYQPGTYPAVPIQVTYRDGSTKVINVPITITNPIVDVTATQGKQSNNPQGTPAIPANYVKVVFNVGDQGPRGRNLRRMDWKRPTTTL